MRLDDIDARLVDQIEDTIKLPRPHTIRVFMDKMPSNRKLMPVYNHAKCNVLRRLLLGHLKRLQPFRIVAVYMFIEILQINNQSTRGRPYDNKTYRRLYDVPSTILIRGEAEIPTIHEIQQSA